MASDLKNPKDYPFYLSNNIQFYNGSKYLRICPLGIKNVSDNINITIDSSNVNLYSKNSSNITLSLNENINDFSNIDENINLEASGIFNQNIHLSRQLTGYQFNAGCIYNYTDENLNFEGDRTICIYFTTSDQQYVNNVTIYSGHNETYNVILGINSAKNLYAYIGGTAYQVGRIQENNSYFVVICVSSDNNKAVIYLNGRLVNTITSLANYQNSKGMILGKYTINQTGETFTGRIMLFRLLNIYCDSEQILEFWKFIKNNILQQFFYSNNDNIFDFNTNSMTNTNWSSNVKDCSLQIQGDVKLSYNAIIKPIYYEPMLLNEITDILAEGM